MTVCLMVCLFLFSPILGETIALEPIAGVQTKMKAATYLEQTKMYTLPNEESDVLRRISANELVEVLELDLGDYCKVSYKGKIGYILQEELIFEKNAQTKVESRGESAIETPSSGQQDISLDAAKSAKPKVYHKGPRGGCYYYNAQGKKKYVEHYLCD